MRIKKPKTSEAKVPVTLRIQKSLHRQFKAAAASKGLSFSDYVIGCILAAGPVAVTGDFIPAPPPAAPPADKNPA